jgi:predicted acetyltransferase
MAPRRVRFGPVTVPAMTVGPVGTHDHYRKQGHAAAAMHDASRYMEQNGVLLGYLRGIRNFYYRFGYYPFMTMSRVTFRCRDARPEARPGKLRVMRKAHIPALQQLFDEVTAGRTFAAVRDRPLWEWLIGPASKSWVFHDPKVILDGRNRLCGYVVPGRDDNEFMVRGDDESCRAALGALLGRARRMEEERISVPVPWDDPFAVFLRRNVPAQFQADSEPTGGFLLKIVDFPALMKALEPMFERRWRQSGARLPAARFTLASELGQVGIFASGRGVRVSEGAGEPVVRVPQRVLSGLLTGYYSVRDVAAAPGSAVPDGLRAPLDVLFPSGWPFAYRGDRY